MKKFTVLLIIYFIALIQSCVLNPCGDDDFSTYYITIERAGGFFYSFDENGVFPHLDDYNRNELGIVITIDSTSERVEVSQLVYPFINSAFACQPSFNEIFMNEIDSVNIFTKYSFDENFLPGDRINEILEPLNSVGETTSGVDPNTLSFTNRRHLKFSRVPKYDSMQFKITGRIQGKGAFTLETKLVVLTK